MASSTYEFTLIVSGGDVLALDTFAALCRRCDDAVFGYRAGRQFADFDRFASSRQEAVDSAIADIESVAGLEVSAVE